MKNNINEIINELKTLDPDFRAENNEYREAISALLSNKPNVEISESFIVNLRERLREGALQSSKMRSIMRNDYSWWLYRFSPAMLAIVLIFISSSSKSTIERSSDSNLLMETPSFFGVMGSPESRSIKQLQPGVSIEIGSQMPGWFVKLDSLSISQPGYVVVSSCSDECPLNIIGTTLLLNPGDYSNLSIKLTNVLREGEMYYVSVHFDDGDGYFSPSNDVEVLDSLNQGMVHATFRVSK